MNTPVLELNRVTFKRRGIPVLDDVSWRLDGGEIVGLIGPNGGGKTALLKVILGLLKPSFGEVRVFGSTPEAGRTQIAYVPQFARFDPEFPISVFDVVLMGRQGTPRVGRRFSAEDHRRANLALNQVDLSDKADRRIGNLSGGEIQRVLIARALAQDAKLVLMDEPAASLDSKVGLELYDLLTRLADQRTVVLVSHDIGVVHKYVTSIACMNRRLHYHHSTDITPEMIASLYGEGVDLVEHPHTHRILHEHESSHD